MVKNIRLDGAEFDPADVEISNKTMPGAYKTLCNLIEGSGFNGLGRKDQIGLQAVRQGNRKLLEL